MKRTLNQLLIQGDSIGAGYGDEEERFGFAGRMDCHYRRYNQGLRLSEDTELRGPVTVHHNSMPSKSAPRLRQMLPLDINNARTFVKSRGGSGRLAAVVVINGVLDYQAARIGLGPAVEEWERALVGIRETLSGEGVPAIYINGPEPSERTRTYGRAIDPELHQIRQKITKAVLPGCIAYRTMLGVDADADVTPYTEQSSTFQGIHPNAEGYRRMAACLIPLVDEAFDIQTQPLPPVVQYDPNDPPLPWFEGK